MKNINIGIITYNRHDELLRLLNSLERLVLNNNFRINQIVIVDNSPNFNSQILKPKLLQSKFPFILEHEKQPGIPFARNKVVELSNDADFLAFIDDDEIADERWLIELFKCQKKYNADVVQGQVIPKFMHSPKKWLVNYRKSRETGSMLNSMATNNTLLKMAIIRSFDGPFNTELALTGGTDALLGRQIIKKGFEVIWCNEAIVYEYVPKSRTTVRWLIQRSFRGGNNYSLQLKILNSNKALVLKRMFVCTIHIIKGILYLPLILLPIKNRFISLLKFSEGIGGLIGLIGYKYNEYKR